MTLGGRLAATEQIDLRMHVDGFVRARARFEEGVKYPEPHHSYHALFEALGWAVSIDERLRFPEDSPELRGVRFARNRVHHQWANALVVDPSGFTFPITFPLVFFEHRWRGADGLPKAKPPYDKDRNEASYREHLEGKPARHTLSAIEEYLLALPDLAS